MHQVSDDGAGGTACTVDVESVNKFGVVRLSSTYHPRILRTEIGRPWHRSKGPVDEWKVDLIGVFDVQ